MVGFRGWCKVCHAVNAKRPTSFSVDSPNVRMYLKQTEQKHIEEMCIEFWGVMGQTRLST
jgi:hypothetical protein